MNASVPIPSNAEASSEVLAIHGKKMEVNHLLNLPVIAESGGVKDWRGKFRTVPGIVVGAGPSLNAAIPHLKGLERKALIIASDRALKPLLAAGIKPHVVASADMDKELAELYIGFEIPDDIVLLYDRDAYHPVVSAWTGRKVTYDTYFDSAIWSREFTGSKGFLGKGGSVGHTAYYLAAMAGCSPVVLVGVDCAFPGAWTHADGVAQVDGGAVDPAHPSWITVEGTNGQPVRSSRGFARYAVTFTEMIHEARCPTINTSEIGAKIEGALAMPLPEFVRDHLPYARDIEGVVNECMSPHPEPFRLEVFDSHLKLVIPALEEIVKTCKRGYEALQEAGRVSHTKDPMRFYQKLMKADKLRSKLDSNRFVQILLWKALYSCAFLMERMSRPIKDKPPLDPEVLWTQAAKLELLFKTEQDVAEAWMECLGRVKSRVCQVQTSI